MLDNEYYFDDVWRIWKRQLLSSTDVDSLKRNISSVYMDGRTASAHSGRRKAFERQKQELLSDIDAGRIRIEPPRHPYTVEIPEDNGMNYLYWDRPVSAEQKGKDIPAAPQGTFLLSGSHGGVLERQVACMEQRERVLRLSGLYVHESGPGYRFTAACQRVSFAGGFYRD